MGDEFLSRRSLGRKTKRSTAEEYYLAKTGGLHGGSSRDMGDLYEDDDNVDEEGEDNAHGKTDSSSSSLPSFAPQEPMLPCEFCMELVKLSDFEGHQLECGRVRGVLRPAQIALAAARAQALAAAANVALAGGGGAGRGPGGQQRAAQAGPGTAVAASASASTAAAASSSHPMMDGLGLYRQHHHHPNPVGGGGGPGSAGTLERGAGSRRNPHGRLHATEPVRGTFGLHVLGPGREMENETTLMGEEDEDVEVTPAAVGMGSEDGDGNDQPLRGVMQAILGALTATTANTARVHEATNGTSPAEPAMATHRQPLHARRLIHHHHHHHHHQAELARSYQQDDNMPPLVPIDDEEPPAPHANGNNTPPASAGDFGYPFQGTNTSPSVPSNASSNIPSDTFFNTPFPFKEHH